MTKFYAGTYLVTEVPESALLRIDIEADPKTGCYQLTDSSGIVHAFELSLQDSESSTYRELAFYALLSYLAMIHAQFWRGTCHTVLAPFGLQVDELDQVIQRFKFNQMATPPIDQVVVQ